MRLQRIYSSKLYLTSPRKDKIKAAIDNALNVELVQQLSDCLDDDAKEKLNQAIEEKVHAKEAKQAEQAPEIPEESMDEMSEDNFPDSEHNVFSPSYSSKHSTPPPAPSGAGGSDIFDIPEGEEAPKEPSEGPAPSEGPVEESTSIEGEAITAETLIEDIVCDIAGEVDIIKGTLNSKEDTKGIQRIAIDDDELWIYYEDKVNIGDIMVNVIETLNGANYSYLTFSRLARSNNAIVFDIGAIAQPVKSIKEVEEES